jgi:hypothetical protein
VKTKSKNPTRKVPQKASKKSQVYELRALGWCGEFTAHKIKESDAEIIRQHAIKNGEEYDNIGGSLEGILADYDCYNTNLWQTGMLPFPHSSSFALYDKNNKEIFCIEKLEGGPKLPQLNYVDEPEYEATTGPDNILVFCEECKGTPAIWLVESDTVPSPTDFTFKICKVRIEGDDTDYVDSVYYKGRELDRDWDNEFTRGKSSHSILVVAE